MNSHGVRSFFGQYPKFGLSAAGAFPGIDEPKSRH